MARGIKSRGSRMGMSNQWILEAMGLYQYKSDPLGMLRNNEKNTLKAWWHDAPNKPASPLRRPPLRWYMLNTEDVDASSWAITESGSGTQLALTDERGGWAISTNGAGNDEHIYYFSLSEIAALVDGKHVWFITEIQVGDVDEADLFVGLCTKLGSGNLFDNRVDSIGFTMADGSGLVSTEARINGAAEAESTGVTIGDGDTVELAFVVTGQSRIDFYVNNAYANSLTAGLPTDEDMALAFGLRNGQAVANTLSIATTTVLLD